MNFVGIQKLNPVSQDISMASYGDDTGLFVEFLWEPVKNEAKSLAEGRAIFENKEYIRILAPGDKTKAWFRPVRKVSNGTAPSDLDRWPRQWQAFQNQQTQVPDGTPLEEMAWLSRSEVMNLKSMNIHVLEQLATLTDVNLTWMGARSMRDKAKLLLEGSKDKTAALKWEKEKQDLQNQIDALKNQLQGFGNSGIVQSEKVDTSPRKRGPKPKVKDVENIPPTDAASG